MNSSVDQRRAFLTRAINGLGALFASVLSFPAVVYLLDPRNRSAATSDFKEVAKLNDLPTGTPVAATVRSARRDAWTLHSEDVIGRVWLIRQSDNTVLAFTTICPHLGCSINLSSDATRFVCPCHNGAFHLSGELVAEGELGRPNPPPRGMDPLESRTVEGTVLVKYENFLQGLHERVRKG